MWNRAGSSAIKLSTTSALLVCFVVAVLFASSMLYYSTRLITCGLFIAAMLTSMVGLTLFLREVYFEIETFEIALPVGTRQKAPDRHMHATRAQK